MPDKQEIEKLKLLVSSISINGEWFKRNLKYIACILLCVIAYITNRYQAQQEVIEEEALRAELEDWKFRCLTRTSELTLKTRQSQIEKRLKEYGDSTLIVGSAPPYALILKKTQE